MKEKVDSKSELLREIKQVEEEIEEEFDVNNIGIFGSFSTDDFDDESDVDIVVEFEQNKGTLRDLIHIQKKLEDVFNRSVDVATLREIEENLSEEELNKVIWI